MASEELERALQAQRDYKAALGQVQDLEEMRRLDATVIPTWSGPAPEDVKIEEIDAGGVPAVSVAQPNDVRDRVLI